MREDAIEEVSHLQRLRHMHIIQVVRTYVHGKTLAILLYPVAEYSLDTFLEALSENTVTAEGILVMGRSLRKSFGCLATALHFVHTNLTKHMNIKPNNILVKDTGPRHKTGAAREPSIDAYNKYKTIIADFGISRAYNSALDADTESPTSYTRVYAAP
jgi:serine/threonine protein kinase